MADTNFRLCPQQGRYCNIVGSPPPLQVGGTNETSKIGPEGGQVGKSDLPPLVQGGQTNISHVRLGGEASEPPSNYV